MIKIFLLIALCLASFSNIANEMHTAPIENVSISGKIRINSPDLYTYKVNAVIDYEDRRMVITSLSVSIAEVEVSIPESAFRKIVNPRFTEMSVYSDTGVMGSYFTFRIPYGPIGKCRKARKQELRNELVLRLGNGIIFNDSQLQEPC